MQTLAFLWYELKAAKRHVKEEVADLQPCGKVDFSLLKKASDSEVIAECAPRQRHLRLRWMVKKETGVGSGPFCKSGT
jgi:hypothetical protein